jgi:hypothetical protein
LILFIIFIAIACKIWKLKHRTKKGVPSLRYKNANPYKSE